MSLFWYCYTKPVEGPDRMDPRQLRLSPGFGQFQHAFDMAELDAVQVPFGQPDRVPDQPAGHRARQLGKLARRNLHRAGRPRAASVRQDERSPPPTSAPLRRPDPPGGPGPRPDADSSPASGAAAAHDGSDCGRTSAPDCSRLRARKCRARGGKPPRRRGSRPEAAGSAPRRLPAGSPRVRPAPNRAASGTAPSRPDRRACGPGRSCRQDPAGSDREKTPAAPGARSAPDCRPRKLRPWNKTPTPFREPTPPRTADLLRKPRLAACD